MPQAFELANVLSRFSNLNSAELARRFQELGLRSASAGVLLLLDTQPTGTLKPSQLHWLVGQTSGGLTKTLGHLEEAGMIERLPNPADRRSLLVVITRRGQAEALRARNVMDAYHAEVLQGVSAADRKVILRALRIMVTTIETMSGRSSTP
jgi:DNA-binding MarR family transcriptional regulator